MPSDTPLGRTCSLSLQVLIINSFLVGVGLGVCVHFSELGPVQAGLNLSSLVHAVTVSVSSYVYELCCVWKMLFLWSYPPPLFLESFCLLFCIDP